MIKRLIATRMKKKN